MCASRESRRRKCVTDVRRAPTQVLTFALVPLNYRVAFVALQIFSGALLLPRASAAACALLSVWRRPSIFQPNATSMPRVLGQPTTSRASAECRV